MRLGAHCDGSERPRYAANTAALHKKTHTYKARRIDDQLRTSRTLGCHRGLHGRLAPLPYIAAKQADIRYTTTPPPRLGASPGWSRPGSSDGKRSAQAKGARTCDRDKQRTHAQDARACEPPACRPGVVAVAAPAIRCVPRPRSAVRPARAARTATQAERGGNETSATRQRHVQKHTRIRATEPAYGCVRVISLPMPVDVRSSPAAATPE